jgi:hypothetical protein
MLFAKNVRSFQEMSKKSKMKIESTSEDTTARLAVLCLVHIRSNNKPKNSITLAFNAPLLVCVCIQYSICILLYFPTSISIMTKVEGVLGKDVKLLSYIISIDKGSLNAEAQNSHTYIRQVAARCRLPACINHLAQGVFSSATFTRKTFVKLRKVNTACRWHLGKTKAVKVMRQCLRNASICIMAAQMRSSYTYKSGGYHAYVIVLTVDSLLIFDPVALQGVKVTALCRQY